MRAAAPVDRLAVLGAQHVDLAAVGERLQRPVDRGQPDVLAVAAQQVVDVLGAAEVLEGLHRRRDRAALPGRAGCPRGGSGLSARHSGSRGRRAGGRRGRSRRGRRAGTAGWPQSGPCSCSCVLRYDGVVLVERGGRSGLGGERRASRRRRAAASCRAGRPARSRPAPAARSSRRAPRRRRPRPSRRRPRPAVPIAIAANSVARKPRVSCWAVATGTTISALTSSRPDGAHRDGDGDRGEHRDQHVVEPHVEPGDPREVLVLGDREQLRGEADRDRPPRPGRAPR